jgi:hypothetical protein
MFLITRGWIGLHQNTSKTFNTQAIGFKSQTTYSQLFKQTWYEIHKQDEGNELLPKYF